jgi:hypothetical protein
MKWMRNILCLLVVCAFSVAEVSAQTTSSATQVVTFGVRRIALQTSAASFAVNALNQNSIKVTSGSQSQFQSAVDFRSTTSEPAAITGVGNPLPASATRESKLYSSKTQNTTSKPFDNQIVTLTQ